MLQSRHQAKVSGSVATVAVVALVHRLQFTCVKSEDQNSLAYPQSERSVPELRGLGKLRVFSTLCPDTIKGSRY